MYSVVNFFEKTNTPEPLRLCIVDNINLLIIMCTCIDELCIIFFVLFNVILVKY